MLAGVGATGFVSVGGLTMLTDEAVEFRETMAVSGPVDLRLDWRETYNGDVLENSTVDEIDRDGPRISLQNVLPGDQGTLSVRVGVDEETDASALVEFAIPELETAENGATDPERSIDGHDSERGDLQRFLNVKLWYDTGLFGAESLGARNADADVGEAVIAEGSLPDVASELEDGVALDPSPNELGGSDCLESGDSVTISLQWQFDANAADVNLAQGDSVAFDLAVQGEQCEQS